jgi:2-polyprenyl-3-methyl-5-hydroxy-6-metoxy-1,4-benzoquinol methylase
MVLPNYTSSPGPNHSTSLDSTRAKLSSLLLPVTSTISPLKMGLKPGMRVLDIGCGVGGPAREIARFADVNIVGLNNNAFQVGRATKYTKDFGSSGSDSIRQG